MNYEEWKEKANHYCEKELGFPCFTDDDEFEIEGLAKLQFLEGVNPEEYVESEFQEDFCRKLYDQMLMEEAWEAMLEQDGYYDD